MNAGPPAFEPLTTLAALTPGLLGLLLGLLGAIIGSYLATVALRWPDGRSASAGRSMCDGCGAELRWFELIPILSFVLSRGVCRRCAAPIAPLHVGMEIGAAALGVLAAVVFVEPVAAIAAAVLFWQLALLAVLDARHLWLPDRLTAMLAVSGLILGGWVSDVSLPMRAIAMIGSFAVMEALRWAFRAFRGTDGMGAGDPKILGALAAWTGPLAVPFILMLAATIGLAAALITYRRGKQMIAFPFGTFLSAATVVVVVF